MKLDEIRKLNNCPDWLKSNIKVLDEDIVIENNVVVWLSGLWKDGIWKDGIWKDGIWENGRWENGIWKEGLWKDGIWKDGTWENGIWKNGYWENGIWKNGHWESGKWLNGIWKDGKWENGIWKDGKWENGYIKIGKCKWDVWYNSKRLGIGIGCKVKPIYEWEEFFNSNEEYETKRNTEQFKEIFKAYKLAKYAIELDNGEIK